MEPEQIIDALLGLEGNTVGLDFEQCKIKLGDRIVELDGKIRVTVAREEQE